MTFPEISEISAKQVGEFIVHKILLNNLLVIFFILLISSYTIYLSYTIFKISDQISALEYNLPSLQNLETEYASKNDSLLLMKPFLDVGILHMNDNSPLLVQAFGTFLSLQNALHGISTSTDAFNKEIYTIHNVYNYEKITASEDVLDEANSVVGQMRKTLFQLTQQQDQTINHTINWEIVNTLLIAWLGVIDIIKKHIKRHSTHITERQ